MRIVFMGTGEIAIPSLRWLLESSPEIELVAVYTQPDKKIGRKQILTAPRVKVIAEEHGLPVFQPETFRRNETALGEFQALNPDLAVVMAYGQILPDTIIETPSIACINLHASLLPRHRGASPIQAAIREGDSETGITLMHVISSLDAGDMIHKEVIPIGAEETGGSLHDRLADLGPAVLQNGLPRLIDNTIEPEPQDESLVTYAGKLERAHGQIDWTLPATNLERIIRAYDPWPGTYTEVAIQGEPKKLKIFPGTRVGADCNESPGTVLSAAKGLTISCGEGSLTLEGDLQLEGRKRLPVEEFTRGIEIPAGSDLGNASNIAL